LLDTIGKYSLILEARRLTGFVNRLTSVWGEDAEKWNPERWFTLDWNKSEGVGMTSNL